jgi:hypothetical protein
MLIKHWHSYSMHGCLVQQKVTDKFVNFDCDLFEICEMNFEHKVGHTKIKGPTDLYIYKWRLKTTTENKTRYKCSPHLTHQASHDHYVQTTFVYVPPSVPVASF